MCRHETEGVARIEEIEREKGKIGQRLAEAEETISSLQEKVANLEKSKVIYEMKGIDRVLS